MEHENFSLELTDLGWNVVRVLRGDITKPQLRIVTPPAPPATSPELQRAAGRKVVVRVASDVETQVPATEQSSQADLMEELCGHYMRTVFYNEDGSRNATGITLANYLLSLADLLEKGRSPTFEEWGKAYATYGKKTVGGKAVEEPMYKLVAMGLVRRVPQAQRSGVLTEAGREWLWKLSKYSDIPSIMSHLIANGKISPDDVRAAMAPPDPGARQRVMDALGLDPIGRKPGTEVHLR